MLLRRLRDRVSGTAALQCIATSATVGSDHTAVVRFASALFDAPFEFDATDFGRQDVVTATRLSAPDGGGWGPLPAAEYHGLLNAGPERLLQRARELGYPGDDPGDALAREVRVRRLRSLLTHRPVPINTAAEALMPGEAGTAAATEALVTLANATRDRAGSPVLSARYHLFARATEGAFTCLGEHGPHVSLTRHERCADCGDAVFEFGACKRCGAAGLAAAVRR
jgi:hypothetical protein